MIQIDTQEMRVLTDRPRLAVRDYDLVSASSLTKSYSRGAETVNALIDASFSIGAGEFVAITGPSGSGKSTMLHLLGCMDTPTSGTVEINRISTTGLSDRELTRLRRENIGFVFQHFGLIPTLSVAENVALPSLFSGRKVARRCDELLERVGLAHRRTHRPHELSGGEMQRVAIARSLINSPQILLADEPTGNLDSAGGAAILRLFEELNADGLTVVVVTHNESLAESAHRRLCLRDGKMLAAGIF